MPQFAYFSPYLNWQQDFPTGKIHAFEDQESVQLDCLTISDNEIKLLRSKREQINLECPICNSRMYYNQGYRKIRPDGSAVIGSKSSYFYHKNDEACHDSESLAHALTKKYLFTKLHEAGYVVREEHRHTINGKKVRADVAAFVGNGERSMLRLVVEVQASNIYPATVAKRVNVYRSEDVPTAWVLLLDDFFESYAGTFHDVIDLEKNTTVRVPIAAGEENPFVVTGKDSRAFMLIMNEYGYVLGLNHQGNVFLIRRDPVNEDKRMAAFMQGHNWTPQDELYKITRIADKDIVPTLELTPLIELEEEITMKGHQGNFFGGDEGQHNFTDGGEHGVDIDHTVIDFEKGKLEGADAYLALNPILLIQETWNAQRQARLNFIRQREEAEEKELAEQELRRIELERIAEEQRTRLEEEQRHAEQERIRQEEEREAEALNENIRQQAEKERTLEAERMARRDEFHPGRKLYITYQQEREIEKLLLLYGYEPVNSMDLLSLMQDEAEHLKSYLKGKVQVSPLIRLNRNEDTIWSAYRKLERLDRQQLERNLFPGGLPPWFATKKFKLEQQEYIEQKKLLKVNRHNSDNHKPKEPPPIPNEEQMKFDF
ncbi:competence protein CoiA family protein [Paenibacillus montanisoli]|uniref:Competence protein CoiA nuclease-like domain-containing protein n=1 Tax=Paenibacillus montanisoli TaxID=2081970 RepID=A0A328TV28_9BACL|nr:competence protein CoiA family protein [Paenibacillus montanisoli]RAP74388.1 hypothetical protein DL346_20110 [Paenibacillus montanisoli]